MWIWDTTHIHHSHMRACQLKMVNQHIINVHFILFLAICNHLNWSQSNKLQIREWRTPNGYHQPKISRDTHLLHFGHRFELARPLVWVMYYNTLANNNSRRSQNFKKWTHQILQQLVLCKVPHYYVRMQVGTWHALGVLVCVSAAADIALTKLKPSPRGLSTIPHQIPLWNTQDFNKSSQ